MCLTAKILTNTLCATKQGNAEEQPDASCGIKPWKAVAKAAAFLSTGYPSVDKPQEFEDRVLISRQAVIYHQKRLQTADKP